MNKEPDCENNNSQSVEKEIKRVRQLREWFERKRNSVYKIPATPVVVVPEVPVPQLVEVFQLKKPEENEKVYRSYTDPSLEKIIENNEQIDENDDEDWNQRKTFKKFTEKIVENNRQIENDNDEEWNQTKIYKKFTHNFGQVDDNDQDDYQERNGDENGLELNEDWRYQYNGLDDNVENNLDDADQSVDYLNRNGGNEEDWNQIEVNVETNRISGNGYEEDWNQSDDGVDPNSLNINPEEQAVLNALDNVNLEGEDYGQNIQLDDLISTNGTEGSNDKVYDTAVENVEDDYDFDDFDTLLDEKNTFDAPFTPASVTSKPIQLDTTIFNDFDVNDDWLGIGDSLEWMTSTLDDVNTQEEIPDIDDKIEGLIGQLYSLGTEEEKLELQAQKADKVSKEALMKKKRSTLAKSILISKQITDLQDKALGLLEKELDEIDEELDAKYNVDQPHPAEEMLKMLQELRDQLDNPFRLLELVKEVANMRHEVIDVTRKLLSDIEHPRAEEAIGIATQNEFVTAIKSLVGNARKHAKEDSLVTRHNILYDIDALGKTCYKLLDILFEDPPEARRSESMANLKMSPGISRVNSFASADSKKRDNTPWDQKKTWGNMNRISSKFPPVQINQNSKTNRKQKSSRAGRIFQTAPVSESLDTINQMFPEKLNAPRHHKENSSRTLGLTVEASALLFDCIYNFRDLGGWLVLYKDEPYRIKLNQVFRSCAPITGSERDVNILVEELKIRTSIDLRSQREFIVNEMQSPFRMLFPKDKIISLDLAGMQFKAKTAITDAQLGPKFESFKASLFRSRTVTSSSVNKKPSDDRGLLDLYKDYLKHCHSQICQILDIFTVEHNYPILIYCNAGKDKTGVISALLLGLLGVDEKDISEDYHASQNRIGIMEGQLVSGGKNDLFKTAPKEVMLQTLWWLKKKYGSLPFYLASIGFTPWKQEIVKKMLLVRNN